MKKHFILIVFLVTYFLIIAFKLVSHPTPFYDWDESIYMEAGREMFTRQSFIPLWEGKAWLEKPPLVPLLYAGIAQIPFVKPEISTRIFTLILSVITLFFAYVWIYKLTKSDIISNSVVFLTALTPIFLQRAQIVNTDVFLFLGWLGYLLFYANFWLGLFFLVIGVGSKSILGLFPLLMISLYQFYLFFFIKHKNKKQFLATLKTAVIQVLFLSIWYLVMFLVFKGEFWKVHFSEHLFDRVTSSIESHFGTRTFYIELIGQQFPIIWILGIFGLIIFLYQYLYKKFNSKKLFLGFFFAPWFIFLNLTKTKIVWYLYPALSQIAFFIAYPLTLLKRSKYLSVAVLIFFLLFMGYLNFYQSNFFKAHYSTENQYYQTAVLAGSQCSNLYILVDSGTRNTNNVLTQMHLTISTTDWYGNHPQMAYYFGKYTLFYYNKVQFETDTASLSSGSCVALEKDDFNQKTEGSLSLLSNINSFLLYKIR